jgi:glucose-1-phosphate thymidylyltransferase
MSGKIVLFEDEFAADLRPVSLTRPAFAVTCACYNLYEVVSQVCESPGWIVRGYLEDVVNGSFPAGESEGGPTLLLNASVAPDTRYIPVLAELLEEPEPRLYTSGQRVAAAVLGEGQELPGDIAPESITAHLLDLRLPLAGEEPFDTFDYPFHIVGACEELFEPNIRYKIENDGLEEVRPGVYVGSGVEVADTAVFHPEEGPIVLDDAVRVLDFTYFTGPVYVGPSSRVIERSSVKEYTSIGHTCKIGGEVEVSTIESYTNKQHHGFLGHAYVGSWVNLGAGTSNSDLKNTYGEVRYDHDGERIGTGLQFLGCIIGDYAKSAINTSIFTGKSVGVASMMYGYVGQNVPSFCNYAKSFGQVTEVSAEQAVKTQRRMFERRGVEQTPEDVALLEAVFDMTREGRLITTGPPVL